MKLHKREISSFPLWTALWGLALTLTWLLPNHYPPWASFHSEAWCAFVMLGMVAGVAVRYRSGFRVSTISWSLLALAVLTWLQWWGGMFSYTGQVWLISGYFSLTALVVVASSNWSRLDPNAPEDTLFSAVALAALVSVGLQLDQWLQTRLFDIWSMGGDGTRPYANLGQPNLLSTFQIWGLMSVLWFVQREKLSAPVAVLMAMTLLLGVAMTQSRTGWLCLAIALGLVWVWRRQWRWSKLPLVATLCGFWFALCVWSLTWLSGLLGVSVPPQLEGRMAVAGDLRLSMWRLLLEASLDRPWFGYGMGNIFLAQVEAPARSLPLHLPTGHAHNFILDAAVSVGWPLALLILTSIGVWLWKLSHRIGDSSQAILFVCLIVVGVHSLLELPLHHLHFLLPTGMFTALLIHRAYGNVGKMLAGWIVLTAAALGFVLLGLISVDYLRVEASLTKLRLEWNRVGRTLPGGVPEVVVLNQLRDWISHLRTEPTRGMTPVQLQTMRDVTLTIPAAAHFYILARALALNGEPQEAALRLRQMCDVFESGKCEMVKSAWREAAAQNPELARVPWNFERRQ